jgi:hypothetical protein
MYGDMSVVRADAAPLRVTADEMRTRAVALTAQAEGMAWNSDAAVVFRTQVGLMADDLGRTAAALDAAADALDTHAASVDAVKESIRRAEAWVAERLSAARTLAANAVKLVEDVAEGAVNGFQRVVQTISDGATTLMRVESWSVFGTDVPDAQVEKAQQITRTVPHSPPSGSKDWLDLENVFASRGW